MDDAFFEDVRKERQRQQDKWGEQRHSWGDWMAILGEEFGEACQEALRVTFGGEVPDDLRTELIQVSAVAGAIVRQIDAEKAGQHARPSSS